MTANNTNMRRF